MDQSFTVAGLGEPAEIIVDRWGIPHIYAKSEHDVFLAQGFNAARDRLWQIDLWRRRGLGLLSEAFGPAYVAKDRAARLFLYRGDMAAEWRCYGTSAEAWTTAFAAGINAYVGWASADPRRLPVEFRLMGHRPGRWQASDVVRIRSHARIRNIEHEVQRMEIGQRFGFAADRWRKELEPEHALTLPEGTPLEAVPPEVMATYRLATEPAVFGRDQAGRYADAGALEGSNNWALAPHRSTTGRAILASDPHRVHEMPNLRYVQHLSAPDLDVIGAGEPCVPGVSLGHNDKIAFGLTIFPVDQEDVHFYDLNPDDPSKYRYGSGWEPFRVIREEVPVRGQKAEAVELLFTRHGPVLHIDRAKRKAWAVRTAWIDAGTAPYLASLDYLKAGDWNRFVQALDGWGCPTVNQIYADVAGNIGWVSAGFAPKRPNWDGVMPVSGDGRYEWAGYHPHSLHPRSYNPKDGWVGSANQMNLPDDFDNESHKFGFEWADRSRFLRIKEALAAKRKHSPEDMLALQIDVTSIAGRRLCKLLPGHSFAGDARKAADMLASWHHRLEPDSAAAALFEIWFMRHLIPAQIESYAPGGSAVIAVPDTWSAVDGIEEMRPHFRAPLLQISLAAAWAEAVKLMGKPETWAWGRLHHAYFEHALSPIAGKKLDVGPHPKGGSGITVNNNGYRATDFRVTSGVSFRMICDVGDWDRSVVVNTPGQSGDPKSPHHHDLFKVWAEEKAVPMLYSRKAVEEAADFRIKLTPEAA
ncbi:MAG: penicillin acylase family protein [Alphaproteobacteria bacterium]|nr:penicillin acylase family protein [Alphaproteobacteria bacterium]